MYRLDEQKISHERIVDKSSESKFYWKCIEQLLFTYQIGKSPKAI